MQESVEEISSLGAEQEFMTCARGDRQFFCALRMRSILIVDDICFSRVHNKGCQQCIYDRGAQDRIFVRLVWVLCDMLEDRATEERRLSEK